MYSDEVLDVMRETMGLEAKAKVNLVSFGKYKKSYDSGSSSSSSNRIAVIVATGEIIFGEGDQNSIGADKFIKEIRKARNSSRVKAIVLRINSPGGNFIASDELWREVYLARQEKPVIASMSNYAASGGYYMAMAADTIVAYPNTITGSIGIFSILFDMSKFMENKLGITSDRVNTGEFSDILTVSRPLTEREKSIFQHQAEEGYETFITKAAQGRGMTPDEIRAIASGRVWTGTQARENGLVDELGNFEDAVKIAAEKAGIGEDYSLRFYPVQKTFWEQILFDLGQDVRVKMMKAEAGEILPYIELLKKIKNYQGVQARMPYDLVTEF
jgi:protease-4